MPTLDVVNSEGKKIDTVELPEVFTEKVNVTLLHQAVVMYLANQRQGTVSTKTRGEVSGGGKKPYKQKGTGRARAGSSRSPLWKGGGVVFGPHPRDFSYSIPKKMRHSALKQSIRVKFQDQKLTCIDHLNVESGKTKDFAKILTNLNLKNRVLAVLDDSDAKSILALRNVKRVKLMRGAEINAYEIMANQNLLVSKSTLETILKKFS